MMVPVTATLFSISVVNCYSFIADADGIPPVDNTIQGRYSDSFSI